MPKWILTVFLREKTEQEEDLPAFFKRGDHEEGFGNFTGKLRDIRDQVFRDRRAGRAGGRHDEKQGGLCRGGPEI